MKNIFFLFLCINLFFLTGCDHVGEIENNRVITACYVKKTNTKLTYGFYVSVPTGSEGGEDSGSKSSAKVYEFDAENFENAIELFEKSGVDKTDVTHISLLVGNRQYFNNVFNKDEKYIRKIITATPLVYSCIYDGEQKDLVECINKEYNSKAEDFVKNIFSGKTSELSCMLSEIVLSANNKFYTSAIPVVEISKKGENKLPEIVNTCFFTKDNRIQTIDKNYHNMYVKWRKKYNPVSKGYKINVNDNKFVVNIKDINILKIATVLARYNIDMLNVRYYGKKCFLTYDKYYKFINDYKLAETIFKSD